MTFANRTAGALAQAAALAAGARGAGTGPRPLCQCACRPRRSERPLNADGEHVRAPVLQARQDGPDSGGQVGVHRASGDGSSGSEIETHGAHRVDQHAPTDSGRS